MNNKGQVVFVYETDSFERHAWLWLPETDYGLPAGFNDITNLSETNAPAIARDINESGIIVGDMNEGGTPPNAIIGMAWTCGSGDISPVELGEFVPGSSTNRGTSAWAVNDETNPAIVGWSMIAGNCACSGTVSRDVQRGFSLRLNARLRSRNCRFRRVPLARRTTSTRPRAATIGSSPASHRA